MQARRYSKTLFTLQEAYVGKSFLTDRWALLAFFLVILYLGLIGLTFLDYGITYDEAWQSTYGEHIIQWYTSLFRDRGALTYWNLMWYGGFFDVIAQIAAKTSPIGVFETRHLVNALFGVLGVIGTYKLGKVLGGSLTGFLSALFLILNPRYYGHVFNNPKDIPFAVLFLFSLFYIIKSIGFLPRVPKRLSLKLGIAFGLTLGIRIGGILLIIYFSLAFCLWLVFHQIQKHRHFSEVPSFGVAATTFGKRFLGICVIAYAVMLVWWPAAQARPIVQPAKALLFTTRFEYSFDVLFEGRSMSNADLPWYYVAKWFLITLPEFYFVALAAGLLLAFMTLVREPRASILPRNQPVLGTMIVLFAAALPLTYTIFTAPVDYDGVRHFLFVIPPLAVLAAVSVVKLSERSAGPLATAGIVTVILGSVLLTVVDMVQLHPHQYVFFNRVFGRGVKNAAVSYDTDYWGNSYKEGVEWLVQNYQGSKSNARPKVASCSYSLSTSYFLPDDRFEYVGSYNDGKVISPDVEPDLLLATTRWDCHKTLAGRVLHIVTRKGAPLLYIIKVSHASGGI